MSVNINIPTSFSLKKLSNYKIRNSKNFFHALTCYDFQTAELLSETSVEMILVGDSAGNVVLGHQSPVHVTVEEMIMIGRSVVRGAKGKFILIDMPFGSCMTVDEGLKNAKKMIQETGAQAVKIEGVNTINLQLIERLVEIGIPVMGHTGLMPQSLNVQGGFYMHGKTEESKDRLLKECELYQKAGAFSVVLECVDAKLAEEITQKIDILTVGIGSGKGTDGQILVINDLLGLGKEAPPKFCPPHANLYQIKKDFLNQYLSKRD